jgi:hypothetical protein
MGMSKAAQNRQRSKYGGLKFEGLTCEIPCIFLAKF